MNQIPFQCLSIKKNGNFQQCLLVSIGSGVGALLIVMTFIFCCISSRRRSTLRLQNQLRKLEEENEKVGPDAKRYSQRDRNNLSIFNKRTIVRNNGTKYGKKQHKVDRSYDMSDDEEMKYNDAPQYNEPQAYILNDNNQNQQYEYNYNS